MAEGLAEGGWIPDYVLRRGIRYRCGQVLAEFENQDPQKQQEMKMAYIQSLRETPVIAIHTDEANQQHYEVPTEFFKLIMGKYMKYSCCLYDDNTKSLDEAEENMLSTYCERAQLRDGLDIMDLGCGWGSFTLYAAKRFPGSKFTSLSNSATQREYIEGEAKKRGLTNIQVFTQDVNKFETNLRFDRIVSIEMFEHMKNYQSLFKKVSSWLKDDGMLFTHVFCHRFHPYDFKKGDWMADNFFSGGTMPSQDLFLYFQQDLSIVNHWAVDGTHYQKTSEAWLVNMDKNAAEIRKIFEKVYGADKVTTWVNKWRLFWLAVAELFGYANGKEWLVTHYLFKKK
eukprot:TRINITY_DN21940_c0_g1_i1.p1 TRINITY_DN21940_c0_g1~~TRINITY_DN21940_c0_g1_i1.p1  ORF type:complete len:363 (-),score=95.65 TRINITY_DN21940_c0_g1_i1:53-1072(-)